MAATNTTAEERFRAAFDRLKRDRPEVLPTGTPVTQNNVAREAGCREPSALRKARFPKLVKEIQAFIAQSDHVVERQADTTAQDRNAREDLQARLVEVTKQRDIAQSQLVGAHRRIMELLTENQRLERANKKGEHSAPLLPG